MEKRKSLRLSKRLLVKFGQNRPDHNGFTVDLSTQGIFIKSSKIFPPGTFLTMELTLPNLHKISLSGRVMWGKRVPMNLIRHIKKSGMGIKLDQVPEDFYVLMRTMA